MNMKNDNFFIYVIPINIIAFAVLLISIGSKTWNSGRQPQSVKTKISNVGGSADKESIDKFIDRELYYTELKAQIEKEKMKSSALASVADPLQAPIMNGVEEKRFGFFEDKKQITAEENVRRLAKKKYEAFTVGYKIQAELADQKAFSEYSEDYKQAFVEEFIRRAEADGFAVEVSDDLIVTNVRSIRRPQSETKDTKANKSKRIDLNQFAN
jgi:hypothetical protein